MAKNTVDVICFTCGEEFKTTKTRFNKNKFHYCSTKCYHISPKKGKFKKDYVPWNKGLNKSDPRIRQSINTRKVNYPNFHKDIGKILKEKWNNEEFRDKMFSYGFAVAQYGKNNGMFGKKHSEETKKLMSQNRTGKCIGNKNFSSSSPTDIEMLMMAKLIENGVYNWVYNMYIEKVCTPDFMLPINGLIIECDGNYWHSFKKTKKRDEEKTKMLENSGWKVLRFKGSEIKMNLDECFNRIRGEIYA